MTLVETLAADFEPAKYKDSFRENILAMIEAKKAGQEIVAAPEPQQHKVVDILEALKASLAMAKKPAASAPTAIQAATEITEKAPRKRKVGGG